MKKISIFYFLFFLCRNKFSNFKTIEHIFFKYGDSVLIQFFKKKILLTKNLPYCLQILSSTESQWSKNSFSLEMHNLLGDGLLLAKGPHWHTHRKIIQPFFNQKNINSIVSNVLIESEKLFDAHACLISTSPSFLTISTFFRNTVSYATSKVLFGITSKKTNQFITDTLNTYLTCNSGGLILSPIKRLIYKLKIKKMLKMLNKIIDHSIEENRNKPHSTENFTQHLLEKGNKTLSQQDLRDEIKTMLFASYETMGESLCWVFYQLAKNETLQNEILADHTLALATSVFKETLRLFPPLWCLGREAMAKTLLDDITFHQGDNVIIPIVFLQNEQKYWTNAKTFDPYRFLNSSDHTTKHKTDNHLAWIPFGYGARGCIGKQLALLEAPALIYLFLKKFKVKEIPKQTIAQKYALSMRSKYPLKVSIEKRLA